MEQVNGIKASVAAVFAALTALWGWFGWIILAWIACMAIDYITGSCAALRLGEWSSKMARDGIWHKMGSVVVVIVAAMLDAVVGAIIGNFDMITLPFKYTIFFCPLVVIWCILTELGSITENAGKLGAPIPSWLVKAIAELGDSIDKTAGNNEESEKES